MNQQLLQAYERELSELLQHAEWLGRASPERAGALHRLLSSENASDGFATQLVQGLAYSLARLDVKLQAERRRLPAAILNLLHPPAASPIPARTIVQFKWGEGQVPQDGRTIPRSSPLRAIVESGGMRLPASGEFRTSHDLVLPPVVIDPDRVQLLPPSEGDQSRRRLRLVIVPARPGQLPLGDSVLRLPEPGDMVRRRDPASHFGLRLYLGGAGVEQGVRPYHALTRTRVDAIVQTDAPDAVASRLNDCIRPVGFDVDESLLPVDPRQPEALRLLGEYAVMREKFLFVDLVGLDPRRLSGADRQIVIDLLLDSTSAAMLDGANLSNAFQVGCVPAVNLETIDLPAIALDRVSDEIELTIDSFQEVQFRDLYSVGSVKATRGGATDIHYTELFSPDIASAAHRGNGGHWSIRRQRSDDGKGDSVFLSLLEFDPSLSLEAGLTLQVRADCMRRSIAELLSGTVHFTSSTGNADLVTEVHPPVWPDAHSDATLELIRTLSTGNGLFTGSSNAWTSIVRLLRLQSQLFTQTSGQSGLMDGSFIERVEVTQDAAGIPGGIARGIKVRMSVAPQGASLHEIYLLLRVLDHALSAFCAAGSFTKLQAFYKDGNSTKALLECPPRAGKIPLA